MTGGGWGGGEGAPGFWEKKNSIGIGIFNVNVQLAPKKKKKKKISKLCYD